MQPFVWKGRRSHFESTLHLYGLGVVKKPPYTLFHQVISLGHPGFMVPINHPDPFKEPPYFLCELKLWSLPMNVAGMCGPYVCEDKFLHPN